MVKNILPRREQSLPCRFRINQNTEDRAICAMQILTTSVLRLFRKNEIILVPEIPDAGKYHRHVQVVCSRYHFGIAD